MVQLIDNGFIRLFALWMIITVKHCSSAIHAPGCWFSNAIRMFLGKYITDVHWFVVVQCYTWRFMSYTSSIICCCNGLSLPNLAWLSARSGCCFSSYLHLTLTVFHQLIIPLRYLTIKFGISLFSPYSASSAPSLQGPSLHSIPIWWCSSIIIILSSGNYFGCSGIIMVGFWVLRWLFLHFQFSVRVVCLWSRQYSILDLIHSSIDIYFTIISSSLLAFNIIFIDLQIVSSIVGV